ncbi:MAG TPA: PASTA domain-containing protein [Trueperaceae bacterium]|nr:PASTA domain-containing protein [Trueperaceae bacterium]
MSLLDGKYEVIGQRPLEGGRTLFDAIAPDGTPLRVEWFDLPTGQEAAFERFRRLLRNLKRDDLAAVHDVVSRPGARYVAWLKPEPTCTTTNDDAIETVLDQHGFGAEAADIRRAPRKSARLYGLAFDGMSAPADIALEDSAVPIKPLRTGNARLVNFDQIPAPALSWGMAVILLVIATVLLFAAFQRRVVDTLIVVPDLLGTDVSDAISLLSSLDLAVEVVPLGSTEAAGKVLAVEPGAGAELRPNRKVRVSYALPAGQLAQTAVPPLVGLDYPDEVNQALTAAGLVLGEVARISAASPGGIVLAQNVSAGERVGSGAVVDVLVSTGPARDLTFVPRLVGLDIARATELAVIAGIAPDRILVDTVSSANGSAGTVLSQSLAPNVTVPRDDAILRLVVQSGTPTSAAGGVPDLVGMTVTQAEASLTGTAGRWRLVVERLASLNLPAGVIVMQSPAPGTQLPDQSPGASDLVVTLNVHPIVLTDPGIIAIVRQPQARMVEYAWTILPGIGRTTAEVWATRLDGSRTLVASPTVTGGDILRGAWRTTDPGPITFELLLGGVPYGDPLLVP